MPIPVVALVVVALALLLKDSLHETWVRVLLGVIAVGIYAVSSLVLRRALPTLEKAANIEGDKAPPKVE